MWHHLSLSFPFSLKLIRPSSQSCSLSPLLVARLWPRMRSWSGCPGSMTVIFSCTSEPQGEPGETHSSVQGNTNTNKVKDYIEWICSTKLSPLITVLISEYCYKNSALNDIRTLKYRWGVHSRPMNLFEAKDQSNQMSVNVCHPRSGILMLLTNVTLHQVLCHGMKSFISAPWDAVTVKVIRVNRFLCSVDVRGPVIINHHLSQWQS